MPGTISQPSHPAPNDSKYLMKDCWDFQRLGWIHVLQELVHSGDLYNVFPRLLMSSQGSVPLIKLMCVICICITQVCLLDKYIFLILDIVFLHEQNNISILYKGRQQTN